MQSRGRPLVCVIVVQLLIYVYSLRPNGPPACQTPLSSTVLWRVLKFMSIESVILSNHLNLCCPLLLLPSIFRSIRVLSSESALANRWPKSWSFSLSISPSNEYSGLISFRLAGLIFLQSKGLSRVFSSTTI